MTRRCGESPKAPSAHPAAQRRTSSARPASSRRSIPGRRRGRGWPDARPKSHTTIGAGAALQLSPFAVVRRILLVSVDPNQILQRAGAGRGCTWRPGIGDAVRPAVRANRGRQDRKGQDSLGCGDPQFWYPQTCGPIGTVRRKSRIPTGTAWCRSLSGRMYPTPARSYGGFAWSPRRRLAHPPVPV